MKNKYEVGGVLTWRLSFEFVGEKVYKNHSKHKKMTSTVYLSKSSEIIMYLPVIILSFEDKEMTVF